MAKSWLTSVKPQEPNDNCNKDGGIQLIGERLNFLYKSPQYKGFVFINVSPGGRVLSVPEAPLIHTIILHILLTFTHPSHSNGRWSIN